MHSQILKGCLRLEPLEVECRLSVLCHRAIRQGVSTGLREVRAAAKIDCRRPMASCKHSVKFLIHRPGPRAQFELFDRVVTTP